jgi:hypothetical protein
VLFDKQTELAAWYLAKYIKLLSPERQRQLRMLAECMVMDDEMSAMLEMPES